MVKVTKNFHEIFLKEQPNTALINLSIYSCVTDRRRTDTIVDKVKSNEEDAEGSQEEHGELGRV